MNDKRKSTGAKLEPECEIRRGEVIATIFKRQAPTGYVYKTFTLSRRWESMASGKAQQGNSFFDGNQDDLLAAIQAASDHIRAQSVAHADHVPEGPSIDDSME